MNKKAGKTIYLDYASLTPVDPVVLDCMYEYDKTHTGNPSGIHADSVDSKQILEKARTTIAGHFSARPEEIFFTGSGTEGDNLAIWGAVLAYGSQVAPEALSVLPHIVTTNIEHSAVRELCLYLEKTNKAEVTYVAVGVDGIVDPKEIKKAIKQNTVLVSVQYANNEIGTIQPIREIAKVIRQYKKTSPLASRASIDTARRDFAKSHNQWRGEESHHDSFPLFHTDAAQAVQYCNINVQQLGVDLLSCNGSKMYGPRGSGILFKKHGIPFTPVFYGGHQEGGVRPGTEDVGRAVGLAKAFDITRVMTDTETIRLTEIREYFIDKLYKIIPDMVVHGSVIERLPNNINIAIPGYNSETVVIYLDAQGIRVSEKSACQSDSGVDSYVLEALEYARISASQTLSVPIPSGTGSIRFTLGRSTTMSDIDHTVAILRDILKLLKSEK